MAGCTTQGGGGDRIPCEEALAHAAALAVDRAAPSAAFADSAAHRRALVRANRTAFLTRCEAGTAADREQFVSCVLAAEGAAASRQCWAN